MKFCGARIRGIFDRRLLIDKLFEIRAKVPVERLAALDRGRFNIRRDLSKYNGRNMRRGHVKLGGCARHHQFVSHLNVKPEGAAVNIARYNKLQRAIPLNRFRA